MSTMVPLISVLLQFAAAALALRLVFVTGQWRAWGLIALALVLLGIRRSITFYRIAVGESALPPDLATEMVTLLISVLMVFGVLLVAPLFENIRDTQDKLAETNKQYHAIVEDQTEMICRHLPDGTRTFVNESYCKFHGKNRAQLIGSSEYAGLPKEDFAKLKMEHSRLTPDNP